MDTDASQGEIEAARGYQALLVPALFESWPPLVADAAGLRTGMAVLDVACGTGVLARSIAQTVGETGRVAGVDPGLGMLTVARELAPDLEWHAGVAEDLPFADASFDAVVSQFGFMFFSDHDAAVRQMLRVLRRGGHLTVVVWDSLQANLAYAEEVEIIERLAGKAAADCVRAPFALGDIDTFRTAFDEHASDVTVTTRSGKGRFPSVRSMLEADLRGWLPLLGVELDESLIQTILEAAEVALADYVRSDGRIEFETSAHILTAGR